MNKKRQIVKMLKPTLLVLLVLGAIAFVEGRLDEKKCLKVDIGFEKKKEHPFLSREEIKDLMTENGRFILEGEKLIHIDARLMEKRIKSNKFVYGVEVCKDLKGVVKVNVKQAVPMFRVFANDVSFYISDKQQVMPTSMRYTPRLLVISGPMMERLYRGNQKLLPYERQLFRLVEFINKDEFLRAQVAQIDIDINGYLTIYPQVTNTVVEFGRLEKFKEKFDKLKLFYEQVLPRKDWQYKKVNLEYKDQIVCE